MSYSASNRYPRRGCQPKVNIINCIDEEIRVELGKSTPKREKPLFCASGCMKDLSGDIDVVVTAPINKENIQSDQFKFPGMNISPTNLRPKAI